MAGSIQEDIEQKIGQFLSLTKEDPNHRYWSWNHCYLFFQKFANKAKESNGNISGGDVDLACLNLAFYLASWGMYRGSSFLLQKDYKIYERVIEELTDPKFGDLWDVGYYDDLLKLENEISKHHEKIERIFSLRNKIKNLFGELRYMKGERKERAHPTDTLVTKILLGTMACVPAYDNYFKIGLREKGVAPFSAFSENSLVAVLNFCKHVDCNRIKTPIENSKGMNTGLNYPLMKIMDMYFWSVGSEKE